ncbi:DUF6206 family protein [Burkholderia sp. BCC0405]|uniref:DUF6206 family protein n=1 Tax=Burkholderia sp. BCC0405 TaxID=2676298 RepID=UPI0015882FC3|nr:DUF6206 family protein [Burkholderia sp. BCC0405]
MYDALIDALAALEQRVQYALDTGDRTGLDVLGYGDSSIVLGCTTSAGRFACKRMPPFATADARRAYLDQVEEYAQALRGRGVTLLDTRVYTVGETAYCVQPRIERHAMLKHALTRRRLATLLDIVATAITDRIGLDADITNWCVSGDELVLLDTNTPLLRDARHVSTADYTVFFASLPSFVRARLTPEVAAAMLEKFYSPRAVALDVLCGLIRERAGQVPYLLDEAAARFGPAITSGELRRYFVTNQTTWALFRRLQRLQRWWSRSMRKQAYPFLLPPANAFAGHLSLRAAFSASYGYRPASLQPAADGAEPERQSDS